MDLGEVFWLVLAGRGNIGDEALEYRQRLRDNNSLTDRCAEDGGEDMDDAGVKIGFDDRGKNFCRVNKSVQGYANE